MANEKRLIDANDLKKNQTVLWDEALGFSDCVLVEDIDNAPTVDAIPVTEEELTHLINDTIAYILKMESDGRGDLTGSRKSLLEKLNRFEAEHFTKTACSCGEKKTVTDCHK